MAQMGTPESSAVLAESSTFPGPVPVTELRVRPPERGTPAVNVCESGPCSWLWSMSSAHVPIPPSDCPVTYVLPGYAENEASTYCTTATTPFSLWLDPGLS